MTRRYPTSVLDFDAVEQSRSLPLRQSARPGLDYADHQPQLLHHAAANEVPFPNYAANPIPYSSTMLSPRPSFAYLPKPGGPSSSPPELKLVLSKASQCFYLADMDKLSIRENLACGGCKDQLGPLELRQVSMRTASSRECLLCQVAETKPEAFTRPFSNFLTDNPTVFHAVEYCEKKLSKAGYQQLPSRESWEGKIKAGGKYYFIRNGSSLIAFSVGRGYKKGDAPGVAIIGTHIDALTARLRPVSKKPNKAGYLQLGVGTYGGALNETWWDRDLAIGGRVVVRDPDTGATSTRLVRLDWPIAKVPTLAPHFGVGILGQQNKETQAVPILGLESTKSSDDGDATVAKDEPLGPDGCFVNSQPPKLVKLIAEELEIESYADILSWDLELYDSQPAQTIGLDRDLISAGRIDDKLCSWGALMGLLAAEDREDDSYIKLVALFDDEEIGSKLRQGAASSLLPSVIERAVEALNPDTYGPGLKGQVYAKTFLLSADVSHAVNPNFLEMYQPQHMPQLNVGIVVSFEPSGAMTTDACSAAVLSRVAELVGAKTQPFQIRNDSRSGGTIGPVLSSALGCRAADAGMPQLSMHSIRATTGALDPGLGVQFFKGFLDHWEQIDKEWEY